jgi:hypothetical protein
MSDYDLRYVAAVNSILEAYLLSRDLYWLPGISSKTGEAPYPSLTPGNLLLALKKAEFLVSSPEERKEIHIQRIRFEEIRKRWLSAWMSKCTHDFRNRLGLWTVYLDELFDDPPVHQDRYAFEVTRRVLLQILQPELKNLEAADEQLLHNADVRLKTKLLPGSFIWEPVLTRIFPEVDYWFLYGTIKI